MLLLLDTHAIIWWLAGDSALSEAQVGAIRDRRNTRYVSAASIWEISIKLGLGKIEIDADYPSVLRSQGFIELPISWRHAQAVTDLPQHHRDPFDRLLVAQAKIEDMTLVTSDPLIVRYDVNAI